MRILNIIFLCTFVVFPGHVWGDWPEFRGPDSNGHVTQSDKIVGLPTNWSESENVKWKTPIPHQGWSTPVIMNGQIWLTASTPDGHDFFAICTDQATGEILFNERMFHADSPEPLGNDINGYASPSPTIEEGRVYIHFGSYGTACIDTTNFETLWTRDDLPCRHFRGPGSSPFLYEDLLILSMDGIDLQYITALDKRTGETIWKTDRTAEWNDLDRNGNPTGGGDFRKAFGTPIVIEVNGQQQLLSVGAKAAYGYDPLTGKELWKIVHGGQAAAPRPLFGHGLVFFTTGYNRTELIAVRTDGSDDVTDSHIAWRTNRGIPLQPSPVLVDDLLYLLSDGGIVNCLEATTGNRVWQERINGEFSASMLYADGNIYCFSRTGETTVFKAGREFEIVATNTLEDGFMASPAVDGQALYLRTKSHLYRIEK